MKISSNFAIKNNTMGLSNTKKSVQNLKNSPEIQEKTCYKLPSTNNYLAFMGGYALKLKEVYENLKSEQYPPDIQKNVERALQMSEKLNLCDVHFEKYKGIEDCYTLEELKEKYPEFSDVESAYNVEAKKDSFLYKFQSGENEIFSNEEDLTLQLIKLYWGKGFSLSDLSKYIEENSSNGKEFNLYYTMTKKLNIPTMNSRYAQVLKLSNKKYNEEFTTQMSIKRKEAYEAKRQREEGEPVIIPSGSLSEAHKRHISEGLKKYYQNNPEAIYNLTQRQKKFLEQNPEFLEKLSGAMDYAWNKSQDGFDIKKHLSKFMRKFNTSITDTQLVLKENLSNEQHEALKTFWDKNPWAKAKMSKAIQEGWDYINNSPEEYFNGKSIPHEKISLKLYPTMLQRKVLKWGRTMGHNVRQDRDYAYIVITNHSPEKKHNERLQKYVNQHDRITNQYISHNPKFADQIATILHYSLTKFFRDVLTNSDSLPASLRENELERNVLSLYIQVLNEKLHLYTNLNEKTIFPNDGVPTDVTADALNRIGKLITDFNSGADIADYLNSNLDKTYQIMETKDMSGIFDMFT